MEPATQTPKRTTRRPHLDTPTDLYAVLDELNDEDLDEGFQDELEPAYYAFEVDDDPTQTGELFPQGYAGPYHSEISVLDPTGKPYVRRYADRSKDTADMYWQDGMTLRHRAQEPFYMAVLALLGNPGRSFRDRVLRPVVDRLLKLMTAIGSGNLGELTHDARKSVYLRYRAARLAYHLSKHQPDTPAGMTARRTSLLKASKLLFVLTFVSILTAVMFVTAALLSGSDPFLAVWIGALATLALAMSAVTCDLMAEGADRQWVASRLKDITAKFEHTDDEPSFWDMTDALPVHEPQFRPVRRQTFVQPRRAIYATALTGGRHRAAQDDAEDAVDAIW
jgi:hypothetical protein